MRKYPWIALLLTGASLTAHAEKRSLDSTSGTNWELCSIRDMENIPGTDISTVGFKMPDTMVEGVVPGVVFTAYVNAGKEEDPNYADNIWNVDVTKYNGPFWYRCEFDTPADFAEGKRLWLNFDNTNRYADFYFNGVKISGTPESTRDVSGHMLRSRFDVTPYVNKNGKNAIAVLITDADQKKTKDAEGFYGVVCSPSYLAGAGWDWMPYVPGRLNGITGHVSMETTGDVVMIDPWIRNDLPTLDRAELEILSDLENRSNEPKKITVEATINPGNIVVSEDYVINPNSTTAVKMGANRFPQLVIENPLLWWPNGYGDPNLYAISLKVKDGDKVLQERKINYGIKKYDYKYETNAVGMPVLQFYVNGQRVFVKGGNWGMSEYLLRCQNEDYEKKIRLHKDLNYNMIRLWTGCVTDDEFYDYCDQYGLMVWNDFWLYVAYNEVAEPEAFKANALDKVKRLRNHPSIALWCGANETHPTPGLDSALEAIVKYEDNGDRMYKSCSNQDGLSGSGWWANYPPAHHFETSASNLAFNTPSYPYGIDHGYGMRSEIGMATFPAYESVTLFIPEEDQWPIPTDDQLINDDDNVWNKHYFGKEASNAKPTNYTEAVRDRWGEANNLEEFCEKAQMINIEDMKGMYEAWNDKMWNDAAGLILWMSHPAYPSFVWQTYDYYYDPTGAYWGAKKANEHTHIQWNALNNSVKAINTTGKEIKNLKATAKIYDLNGKELKKYRKESNVDVPATGNAEAFVLNFAKEPEGVHFIVLELFDADHNKVSDNFYWRNGKNQLDYKAINNLPEANVEVNVEKTGDGKAKLTLANKGKTVAFSNRVRLLDSETGERILPVIMSENYVTLMPGEKREMTIDYSDFSDRPVDVMVKQYRYPERKTVSL